MNAKILKYLIKILSISFSLWSRLTNNN